MAFNKAGFYVMSHPYMFHYLPDAVSKRRSAKFLKTVLQYTALSNEPETQPKAFDPHFRSRFMNLDCLPLKCHAAIWNILLQSRELTEVDFKQPLPKTDKIYSTDQLYSIFTPVGDSMLNPCAGTIATAIASISNSKWFKAIEREFSC